MKSNNNIMLFLFRQASAICLSVVIMATGLFLLAGCKSGGAASGTADIASNAALADGYTLTTDESGNTEIRDADGTVIASTADGDDITVAGDGTVMITRKDGTTAIINPDGSKTETSSDGVSQTVSGHQTSSDVSSVTETDPSSAETAPKADTTIQLSGNSAKITGSGASVSGGEITVTGAGTYAVSGTLNNGRIVVNAPSKKVTLILNGASITCQNSSPIYVYQALSATVTAYEGSVNLLTDGSSYRFGDSYSSQSNEEPDAALYSKADLILDGIGKLIVNGNFNNGVTGKDALTVKNLTLTVKAENNGITGRDSAAFEQATVTVSCGGNAVRTTNTDSSKGKITAVGTVMSLTAGEDGIQAESSLNVQSGVYRITTGGGSGKTASDAVSTKGIKATAGITVSGGSFSVDSSDDALHSNGNIDITVGNFVLQSGDDGLHADGNVTLSGGSFIISNCYEGLEGTNITLSGANVKLTAQDDGVNICGGGDTGAPAGRGPDQFTGSGGKLSISGGLLYVNASGDGLDANGSIEMSGGTVLIDGPTNSGNGALDFDSGFTVTGGFLVAAGSAGMAQTPSDSSTQYSLAFQLSGTAAAGTLFHLESNSGTAICTFAPAKAYGWVCVSSPSIQKGETYTAYTGGSCTGTGSSGLYSGGVYTKGQNAGSLTVSGTVTSNGGTMGGGMIGGKGGGMDGPAMNGGGGKNRPQQPA